MSPLAGMRPSLHFPTASSYAPPLHPSRARPGGLPGGPPPAAWAPAAGPGAGARQLARRAEVVGDQVVEEERPRRRGEPFHRQERNRHGWGTDEAPDQRRQQQAIDP